MEKKDEYLTIRVPASVKQKLIKEAKKQDRTLIGLVNVILKKALANDGNM